MIQQIRSMEALQTQVPDDITTADSYKRLAFNCSSYLYEKS